VRRSINGDEAVELDVVVCGRRQASDAIVREGLARGADRIVLADPGAVPLVRRERRRFRRRSAVPVHE
jgi:tRNA threonylcarbamoyladenosine modification (KEOPS) complex Cgi121 subunit